MNNDNKIIWGELRAFLILWSTQSLSTLGTSMTNFALLIWAYQQHGSALITALLAVCTYTPYVLLSIFAGAFSDRWDKKKILLVDKVFEPFMSLQAANSLLIFLFGAGKGSGAAFLFFVIGIFGMLSCLPFRFDKAIKQLES